MKSPCMGVQQRYEPMERGTWGKGKSLRDTTRAFIELIPHRECQGRGKGGTGLFIGQIMI